MIIATETTNESIQLILSDHTFLQAYSSAKENIRQFRPAAFKRDIEAFIAAIGYAVSKGLARPKGKDFSTDGALYYLCVEVLDDPEFYGRISYYFEDEGYNSIDVGTRLYNELLKKLCQALGSEYLGSLYIRMKPPAGKNDNEVREVIDVGDIKVELSIMRTCSLEEGLFYPKIYIEFIGVKDPKAMCKLVLIDGHDKAKTRPIIFQLSEYPNTKKAYFFELGPESLGAHSHALLGARVSISHRLVSVKNGKTSTKVVTDSNEALLDVYLKPVKKD